MPSEPYSEFVVGGNEAGMILGKVVTAAGETRHATGDRLPPHPALPGLEPPVERFFRQLG
jgi:hypothetical protein